MDDSGIKKIPGISWININGKEHRFTANDNKHANMSDIQKKLKELYESIVDMGFKPNTTFVLKDIPKEAMEEDLCGHSEKLAIAFGLLKVDADADLTVYKNLRVCGDCHEATKWISKATNRLIKVRDARRWHFFNEGLCSCGGLW
eukprot:TRINITY_DN3605_c0_g5_i1.p1 TRINITY_DN3605_c0_g5~~TRINITY_DN3605_c0_g5_i1.p1  ORF type:complete len:158 (-),score=30.37 TRINITY_DN3605_c0_g5_i1:28-462(-)